MKKKKIIGIGRKTLSMTHVYEPYGIYIAENYRSKKNKIADGIIESVKNGKVQIGKKLMASNRLANELGIAPNTVLAAYKRLAKLGWVDPMNKSGTYISLTPPLIDPDQKPTFSDQLTLRPTEDSDIRDDRLARKRYFILGRETDNPAWLQGASKPTKNIYNKMTALTQKQWNSIAERDDELRTAAHKMLTFKRKMYVPKSQLALSGSRNITMFIIFNMLVHRGVTKVVMSERSSSDLHGICKTAGLGIVFLKLPSEGFTPALIENAKTIHGLTAADFFVYTAPGLEYAQNDQHIDENRMRLVEYLWKNQTVIVEEYASDKVLKPLASKKKRYNHVISVNSFANGNYELKNIKIVTGPTDFIKRFKVRVASMPESIDPVSKFLTMSSHNEGIIHEGFSINAEKYEENRIAVTELVARYFPDVFDLVPNYSADSLWLKAWAFESMEVNWKSYLDMLGDRNGLMVVYSGGEIQDHVFFSGMLIYVCSINLPCLEFFFQWLQKQMGERPLQ